MAVTQLKVQLEFRMGPDGWSEIVYHPGSSPKAFLPDAQALVNERKKGLSRVGNIHHVRISGAQPGARSFRFAVVNGAGGMPATAFRDAGMVTTNVDVYGATAAYRKLQLHGYPDVDHRYDTNGLPDLGLHPTILAYLTFLKTNGYTIRHTIAAAGDAANKVVTDITVDNGIVTFVVDTTGLNVGDKVRISGVKGFNMAQFRGTWTVGEKVAGPPTSFKSFTTRTISENFFYVKGSGRLRGGEADDYTFEPIDTWGPTEEIGSRRTGRPTDEHRGRRSRQ